MALARHGSHQCDEQRERGIYQTSMMNRLVFTSRDRARNDRLLVPLAHEATGSGLARKQSIFAWV